MVVRIGINGFGRIGRLVFRAAAQSGVDVVAVNDLTDAPTLAHLLKYDSTHGRYPGKVEHKEHALVVDGRTLTVHSERDPSKLPWSEDGADIVIEATGFFTDKEGAAQHLKGGAKRVIISAPGKGDLPTVVMGINDDTLTDDDRVISNASCTTNCLAPMVKTLNDAFGVERGLMTTIPTPTRVTNGFWMRHTPIFVGPDRRPCR